MSREPRAPLTVDIVTKGQGAVPEAIPDAAHPIAAAPAKEPMTALTVRLPESLAERLRVAFRTRRGKGDLIVEALARFLDGAGV